jgi:hypothetical protein
MNVDVVSRRGASGPRWWYVIVCGNPPWVIEDGVRASDERARELIKRHDDVWGKAQQRDVAERDSVRREDG